MADLPVQPVLNYGQLLSSFGEGLADQENAATNRQNANTQMMSTAQNIQQGQAQTQLIQQQAQGAGIANQRASMQNQYYAHLLDSMQQPAVNDQAPSQTQSSQDASADQTATSVGTQSRPLANADGLVAGDDDTTIQDTGLDLAHIDNSAQQQFAVKNVWQPQELQQLQLAMASGIPGAADTVAKLHDARIQSATARAQLDASRVYNNAAAIATAPDGTAFAALQQLSPNKNVPSAFQALAKQKGWSADDLDEHVRIYANEVGNAAHRFSGRDIAVGTDGIARDAQTNQPLLGGVPAGMNAEQYQKAYAEATKLTTVNNSDGSTSQVPTWRAAGASSATQYINAGAGAGKLPTRGIPPQFTQPATAAPVQGAAPGQPPQGAAQRQSTQQPQPSAPVDPVLRQALADPDYKLQTPPVISGRSQTPAQLEQSKATVAARNDLVNESQNAITTASQSITYLDAAKAVLDSKGVMPKSGPVAGLIQQVSRVVGGDYATNYQEIAKYLGNAALQNGKANFGKNFTQKEVDLQLNQLSPSNHMTDSAVSNLIDSSKRNMQYAIASAQRSRQYLAAGGDPQQFADWNQKYWDRSKIVNQGSNGASAPAVGTVRGNYRFKGGDPSNKANWVQQ
jgi:hypothetical protein